MLQAISEYFKGHLCHYYISPGAGVEPRNEIVVLVHGLLRRSLAFYSLGKKLSKLGYTVCVYDYQTTIKKMPEHGADFKRYLERIAEQHPDMKINLVTHSMGGILTRLALGHLAEEDDSGEILTRDRFKRIVMLAPPHRGSDVAKRFVKYLPVTAKWIKPLAGLSSEPDAAVHTFPYPVGLEVGVIAGRFDSEVSLEYTHFPGEKEHTIINSEHSFMMYMPAAIKTTIKFLETGHF